MTFDTKKYCAARSVHLRYDSIENVDLFYNEVIVKKTTPGSYFMVCGWSCGYFGIQHLASSDEKVALFSVWDPTTGDDPNQVPLSDRVLVEDVGEGVQPERFGGEGTGSKLMAPLPWKVGDTIACFVTAQRHGQLSSYTGWIRHPERDDWWRLGTLTTRTGALLTGLHSFIEDFRRDITSCGENRLAMFSNGWVRTVGQQYWFPLSSGTFTASDAEWELKEAIDAGTCFRGFYLSTGGDVCSSVGIGSRLNCSNNNCKLPVLPALS